ncbi:hypothetical protein DPSP01_003327 [Paraphaeosphaeria sporulosa]
MPPPLGKYHRYLRQSCSRVRNLGYARAGRMQHEKSEREICSLLTHGNAATFITDQDLPVRVTVVQLGALKRTVKAVESFTRIPPMHQLTGTTGANASYANPNT